MPGTATHIQFGSRLVVTDLGGGVIRVDGTLGAGDIVTDTLADGSVVTVKLADAAVTGAKIAAGTESYVLQTVGGVVVWAPAPGGDPVVDPSVWMPLTTVVGGVPELVWDADDSLIPTLTPI